MGRSLVGSISADVVGIQHYTGTLTAGETVELVREPANIHDEMAIQVLNSRDILVGYIKHTAAEVLAPLMDSQLIFVYGIVPKVPSVKKLTFINSQVRLFARDDDFEHVKSTILEGKLMLIPPAGKEVRTPPAGKEVRAVDESFTLVSQNVRKKAKTEALEPPREFIKTVLFEHQKQGLGWLVHRENSGELPPFWEEMGGKYINVLTNCLIKRPEPLRGGIFADQMGLGKTLTLLSLIALDKSDGSMVSVMSESAKRKGKEKLDKSDGSMVSVMSESAKRKGKEKMGIPRFLKKSRTGPNSSSSMTLNDDETWEGTKSTLVGDDETWEGTKSTLVVCPPSALPTWISQLGEHTNRMTFYSYHGRRTSDAEELRKHDIVLTTYAILANEQPLEESPLKKIEWWRVILDEAHVIKNVNAQRSQAVTSLNARRRWAVTGTPLQNNFSDLFSLMVFLQFVPFSIKSYWQSLIQHPVSQLNKTGLSHLQVLMATLSLRRTKDEVLIGLPQKTIETSYFELSFEERELYDHMEREAKIALEEYAFSMMRNYTAVLGIILRLRQICSSRALCPPEVTSLLLSNKIEDVSNNPELLKKLVAVLQDSEDIGCPVCVFPCTNLIITRCAHIYCRACILKTLKISQRRCPLCRGPLTESDLFSRKSGEVENRYSTKVSALLKLLLAAKNGNLSSKSVVFSQFSRMLLILEGPLREAGFKIMHLDGCAKRRQEVIKEFGPPEQRQEVIKEFGAPEQSTATVLLASLASLKESGAGLNLTAASTVYLLEPWWDPAVEEQATDRVHRIGQNEDVKIVRLIARDSIEERILKVQERKKELAEKAFGKWASTDGREIGLDDLIKLVFIEDMEK